MGIILSLTLEGISMKTTGWVAVLTMAFFTACGPTPEPKTGPPAGEVKPSPPPTTTRTKYLKVHVINVGQADGIIIECPNDQVGMVIDSADSRDKAGQQAFEDYLSKLMEKDEDKSIPLVVATHPHSDHIGHLKWVVENYGVGVYVDNGQKHTSKTYRDLMAAVKAKSMPYMAMDITPPASALPKPWKICGGDKEALVTVLVPSKGYQGCRSHPNDCSVVLRLDYGKTSYLFAGDAEHKQEEQLMADQVVASMLDVDVLKAGHHGSDTSSTWKWLEAVTPKCVLVSVGEEGVGTNKRYRHPRASTMESFNKILKRVVPSMGWRQKTAARAYDKDKDEWVDLRVRAGVSTTPMDGDVVSKTDGERVTCR